MARLPQPGGDVGTWGDVLNDYLSQSHNSDGTLKAGVIDSSAIQDGSVNATKLATSGAPGNGQVLSYNGSALVWVNASVAGTADHGSLTGLANDDHPQYHDDARGDARYYTQSQVDARLAEKTDADDARLSDERAPTDASVSTAKLQDGAVTEPKLAASNAPTSGHLLSWNGSSLAWTAAATSDPAVGGDLSGTASNAQIIAGAVGATELATNSVTTIKIADANVTTAKIADSNVTTGKLANSAVDATKLANNAVTTTKISTTGAPGNGQLLSYNGTALEWVTPGSVPTALDDLSDVTTTGATDGQSLVYQSGSWTPATITSGGGVTDHGALTGLTDDDHPHYLNTTRGDARYYTQTQVNTSLAGKVDSTDARLSDERVPTDTSVSTAKLQDNAVTEPKLAVSNAPTSGHLLSWNGSALAWTAAATGDPTLGGDLSGTASNAQIAAGSVGTAEIADLNVTNVKLANGTITDVKIATGAAIAQSKIANLTTDLAGKASTTHTHAIADVANLQTTLNAKAASTVTVTGATSLTGGGDLSANRTISLVNDSATPGNSKYYGTNGTGTKGYYDLPVAGTGDPALGGDLTGTASNAQIAAGAVGNTELATDAVTNVKIAAGAAIAQSKIANLTTDLAGKASTTHTHTAADIASGTVATARLGSGTASASTYLRGDGTWATPSASASAQTMVTRTTAGTAAAGQYILANAATSGFTITLPDAQPNGTLISVKKTDSGVNGVIIVAQTGQIEGNASLVLNQQWESLDFISDGTSWYRM